MIKLTQEKPFGRGSHRKVYRHPAIKGRGLKVMIEAWEDRRKRASWIARIFRPSHYFHENLSELRFSKELEARVGEVAWGYIAQSHKIVETDQGEALEITLVTDPGGEISPTLKAYLLKYGMTDECKEAIDGFWAGVAKFGVFVQGRPDNLSVSQNEDGALSLIAIDGFGLTQMIPLAKWFGFARRRFIRTRRKKQDKNIAKILEARKSGEGAGDKGMVLDAE